MDCVMTELQQQRRPRSGTTHCGERNRLFGENDDKAIIRTISRIVHAHMYLVYCRILSRLLLLTTALHFILLFFKEIKLIQHFVNLFSQDYSKTAHITVLSNIFVTLEFEKS